MVADRGNTADCVSVGAAFGERSELARQRLVRSGGTVMSAPSEWSFGSLGEDEEIDDTDWWKTAFLMGLCRPLPTFSRIASS
jgi:hypothetical protein